MYLLLKLFNKKEREIKTIDDIHWITEDHNIWEQITYKIMYSALCFYWLYFFVNFTRELKKKSNIHRC